MIWSGQRIIEAQKAGEIVIRPFSLDRVNPNSYNVSLHKTLAFHVNGLHGDSLMDATQIHCIGNGGYHKNNFNASLDMKEPPKLHCFDIPDNGYWLVPGRLYLGMTEEYTETHQAIPMLEGRSNTGRLGMFIHVTAGVGDIGFCGRWVLEIMVVEPLKIYAGVQIGQLIYHEATDYAMSYSGRGQYQNTENIKPSGLWKELNR